MTTGRTGYFLRSQHFKATWNQHEVLYSAQNTQELEKKEF